MGRLLSFSYQCAYLAAFPWLAFRIVTTSGWRSLARRFGRGLGPPLENAIWLHGASAGEIGLLAPLIERLERDYPESSLVVTASSSTGLAAASKAFPTHRVVECPVDFSFAVRRFLRNFHLRLAILVESEFWPASLSVLHEQGVPVAIVNGRMSARSFDFHRRTGFVARALGQVNLIAVQTEEHAERMRALGVAAERIFVTGNMKHDLAVSSAGASEAKTQRERLGFDDRAIVVIGGSLHEREHAALLDAYVEARRVVPALRLILAPRYPADAAAVAAEASGRGLQSALMTEIEACASIPPPAGSDQVVVVNTVGQLRQLYAVADIAFVGGSLFYRGSNKGGHNVMEPAICAIPILVGPYNFSFKQTVDRLLAEDAALEVHDTSTIAAALTELARDTAKRQAMGQRARQVVLDSQGATTRNYTLLQPLLARAATDTP